MCCSGLQNNRNSFFCLLHSFSGSTQRYCQVDFRTSAGVTAATALNGQCLLGVPLVITVIDPASSTAIHPLLGAGAPLFSGASAAGGSSEKFFKYTSLVSSEPLLVLCPWLSQHPFSQLQAANLRRQGSL